MMKTHGFIALGALAAGAVLLAACVQPPPTTPPPEPELCPVGYYSATGEAPCTPAPPGSFVGTVGATEATLCPRGSYQPNAGATECVLAPIGAYVDTVGATAPTSCPVGMTTSVEGSDWLSDCWELPLVVAYSDNDATGGYDPTGDDVMIAGLFDSNSDGIISAGDTVQLGSYPLSFDSPDLGTFLDPVHSITSVNSAHPVFVEVVTDAGTFYWTNYVGPTTQDVTAIAPTNLQWSVHDSTSFDWVDVEQGAPGNPWPPVSILDDTGTRTYFLEIDFNHLWQYEMLRSINTYRAAAGVQTVTLCGNLYTAAQRHADDMSLNDFLGHTGTDGSSIIDRVTDAGYGSFWPAELIAMRPATASAAVDLWYGDVPHNPLLLDPNWTHLGAGRSELGGGTNDPYWVALLGQGGDCGSA